MAPTSIARPPGRVNQSDPRKRWPAVVTRNDQLVGGEPVVVESFRLRRFLPGQVGGCKAVTLGKAGDQSGQSGRRQRGEQPSPGPLR